jgi:hypothetical protein
MSADSMIYVEIEAAASVSQKARDRDWKALHFFYTSLALVSQGKENCA